MDGEVPGVFSSGIFIVWSSRPSQPWVPQMIPSWQKFNDYDIFVLVLKQKLWSSFKEACFITVSGPEIVCLKIRTVSEIWDERLRVRPNETLVLNPDRQFRLPWRQSASNKDIWGAERVNNLVELRARNPSVLSFHFISCSTAAA